MINMASVEFSDEEIQQAVDVFESGMVREGEKTEKFEEAFRKKYDCNDAVALSSGTAALHLTFYLLGRENPSRNEVITTPFSFIATSNTMLLSDLEPVYVDIDPRTFNLDPTKIEDRITEDTLAIAPVHLFGLPCDYGPIRELCDEYDLYMVNDACQAIHAEYEGTNTAALDGLNCFSFYVTKNLGIAEGGMVTSNHEELTETIRLIKHQGQSSKYHFTEIGLNYRTTDVLAAVGLERLEKIDEWTETRRRNARMMTEAFKEVPAVTPPLEPDNRTHCYHQYCIRFDEDEAGFSRDEFQERLEDQGVSSQVIYPEIIPRQPLYRDRVDYEEGGLPVAESVVEDILALPVHQDLDEQDVKTIIEAVRTTIVGSGVPQ